MAADSQLQKTMSLMRRSTRFAAGLFTFAVVLAACSEEDLAGNRYVYAENAEITLRFEDGSVRGYSGCNSYSAEVAVSDGEMTFGDAVSTLRACADQDRAFAERRFLEFLEGVDHYEVEPGGDLVLTGPSGDLRLVPER